MKKFLIPISFIICFCSCQKSDKIPVSNYESTAILMDHNAKDMTTYLFTMMMGHSASECRGCVMIFGRLIHMDCMGDGRECAQSTIVSLSQISGNNYTATTLDSTALTNEDFFNMPSRSLFVEYDEKNNEVWLNIPAQLVFRDSTTQQFSFTNLYYSNSQIYEND